MKTHRIVQQISDNIPGFRDKAYFTIFEGTEEECREEIKNHEDSSYYHGGYGAGGGTVDTYYYIEKITNE